MSSLVERLKNKAKNDAERCKQIDKSKKQLEDKIKYKKAHDKDRNNKIMKRKDELDNMKDLLNKQPDTSDEQGAESE